MERHAAIQVKGLNRHGKPMKIKAEGWLARIFQHEIDHLNGVLFTDRATRVSGSHRRKLNPNRKFNDDRTSAISRTTIFLAFARFWMEHWGDEEIVARGAIYRPEQLEGFIAKMGMNGWVRSRIFIKIMNVRSLSLDSMREGQGIGTKLINAVSGGSRERKLQAPLSDHDE